MKKRKNVSHKGEIRVLIAYEGTLMPLSIIGKLSPKTITLGKSTDDGSVGELSFSILKDARQALSDVLSGKGSEESVRWGTKLTVVDEGDGESSYKIDASDEEQ